MLSHSTIDIIFGIEMYHRNILMFVLSFYDLLLVKEDNSDNSGKYIGKSGKYSNSRC